MGRFVQTTVVLTKLIQVKLLHTAVWVFFNAVIFYLLYAVLTNKIDGWVWVGIGAIVLEGLVLLAFRNVCPLTLIARKYSNSTKANFDIYLPEWLARYNKWIYGILFAIIVSLYVFQLV